MQRSAKVLHAMQEVQRLETCNQGFTTGTKGHYVARKRRHFQTPS